MTIGILDVVTVVSDGNDILVTSMNLEVKSEQEIIRDMETSEGAQNTEVNNTATTVVLKSDLIDESSMFGSIETRGLATSEDSHRDLEFRITAAWGRARTDALTYWAFVAFLLARFADWLVDRLARVTALLIVLIRHSINNIT